MKKKFSKPLTAYIFAILFLVFFLSYNKVNRGNVLGRSYPPSSADISSKAGGTIQTEGVTLIVKEGTFDEEVYFRVDKTTRGNPISVDGLWQISDVWEARIKYMLNNDQVTEFAAHNNYILSFPYTSEFLTTDQGVTISPSSLKIIRGETIGGPWTIMADSIVDDKNMTVSILTNRGGFFMIAGGYHQPTKIYQESTKINNPNAKTIILKENEIVVTLAPTRILTTTVSVEKPPHKPEISGSKVSDGIEDAHFYTNLFSVIRSFFSAFLP